MSNWQPMETAPKDWSTVLLSRPVEVCDDEPVVTGWAARSCCLPCTVFGSLSPSLIEPKNTVPCGIGTDLLEPVEDLLALGLGWQRDAGV